MVSLKALPALLLVVLAVALVFGGVWLVYDDYRPTYRLTVTDTVDAPADIEVIAYEDLPSEAKTAFEGARDDAYVVHHEPTYLETFPLHDAVYVQAGGTVYELWASGDGLDGLSFFLAIPMGLLAVGLGALGVRSYRHGSIRTPLTVLASLGAAVGATIVWPLTGSLFLGTIPIVPIAVATIVASTSAWVGLGRYDVA